MKGRTYRADGGKTEEGVKVSDKAGTDYYAGGDSNVRKEAEERTSKFKKGGRVKGGYKDRFHEAGGMHEYEKLEKEKKVAKKDGGCAMGDKSHSRSDRAPRKSGGRVARANGGPLSTASKTSERPDFKGMKDIND